MKRSKLVGILLVAATGLVIVAVVGASVLVASWREPLVSTASTPSNESVPNRGAAEVGNNPASSGSEQK